MYKKSILAAFLLCLLSVFALAQGLEHLGDSLSLTIFRDGTRGPSNRSTDWTTILVFSLVFGPFLVFGVLKLVQNRLARGRQTEFKKKMTVTPGEVPETAIHLNQDEELASHLAALSCSCGTPYYRPEAEIETASAIFDGRRLLVVELKCETCRQRRDVYFMRLQSS